LKFPHAYDAENSCSNESIIVSKDEQYRQVRKSIEDEALSDDVSRNRARNWGCYKLRKQHSSAVFYDLKSYSFFK